MLFVDENGQTITKIYRLKSVECGTAEGLHELVKSAFLEIGITDLGTKLIGFMSDGASVNFGSKNGLAARLKQSSCPRLTSIHCLNHRLELALKEAFKGTYVDKVEEMLMSLYYLYECMRKVQNV